MFETIRRAMLIGLGAADMAAERVQHMVDDLVQRGEVTADQGRELYSDIMNRMEERGRMENERMRAHMRETMRDMGIPDRTQMEIIEARIDNLERKIDQVLDRMPADQTETVSGPVT